MNKKYYKNFSSNIPSNIPKIIHQTAPSDKNKWHPIWHTCQESWLTHFKSPEYEYRMWSDEDLDNLIKTDFNYFYDIYKSYSKNINRIDIARYFILYKYGGIYADMDYKCFNNFYNIIPSDKISISESPYKYNEHLQNALMISPKNHPFWIKVINEAIPRSKDETKNEDILYQTGPVLISDVYFKNKDMVNVLPKELWNPHKNDTNETNIITKHYGSVVWFNNNH